jgi:hypothetical protein
MTPPNRRIVQRRDDGGTEVRKPGATRATRVLDNQAAGIEAARWILANDGGGELQVRGLNGQIRKQDTVDPGKRPAFIEGLSPHPPQALMLRVALVP